MMHRWPAALEKRVDRGEFKFVKTVEGTPMNNTVRVLLAAAIAVSFAACAKKTKPDQPEVVERDVDTTTEVVTDDGKFGPEDLDSDSCLRQRVVYFDFDRSDIRGEAQQILSCHAKYLVDRPSAAVTLEGHADERGSREYNIGLGERRAQAVRRALMLQGVTEAQITTVSYGEERPSVQGSDESAYAKNRRVELVYGR
jgi:peptidoglycan-associated lipoprotein